MSDHADLTALVHRAQQLAAQAQAQAARYSLLPVDEKEGALRNYHTIAGLCARIIERLRPQGGPVPPETVEAVQALIMNTTASARPVRREHARRWSEVHDEFEAAQREGRPMRSDWSWELHARWEGAIA
jgi:hypothetical protein